MSTKDLIDIFVPSADSSEATVARWRMFVGLGMVLVFLCLTCIYMIKANASEVDDLKVAVYIPAMEKAHQRYCLSSNEDTRSLLRRQVNQMQLEYRRVTGDRYPLESCEEIRGQDSR